MPSSKLQRSPSLLCGPPAAQTPNSVPCILSTPGAPELLPFAKIQERPQDDTLLVEGEFAVQRLLRSPLLVQSIIATPKVGARLEAMTPESPIYILQAAQMRELAGYAFHRGCMASALRPPLEHRPVQHRGVVAMGLSDPLNLGAIIRNIRAFDAAGLWLGPHCADPWSRRATRASMGHNLHLPIHRLGDPLQALKSLRARNTASIAAALQENSQSLPHYHPPERWSLWLGNEGHGLEESIVRACTDAVEIPMAPDSDSLNVATASGIFLYHLTSHRESSD